MSSPPKPPSPRPARPGISPRASAPGGGNARYSGGAPKRRKPTSRKRRGGNGQPPFWKRASAWRLALSTMFMLGIILCLALLIISRSLPDIEGLNTIRKQPGITMKTRDGVILVTYGQVYGRYIPYEQIPKHLIDAVLSTEDRRFFRHGGIDLFGISRAVVVNMTHGGVRQGGSTITQQVAKNVFLTPDRTLTRKLQEMLLAFRLEARFSKEEILAIYLNRVYLGAGTYGFDAASQRYFGKAGTDINLVEAAAITGLLKAPSRYSPASNFERAKKRAHQVLLNMVDAGKLEKKDVAPALAQFQPPPGSKDASNVRYFTDWLIDTIPGYIGQIEDDLIVTTTLDLQSQAKAETAVAEVMDAQGEAKRASQAALVGMDKDGAIRAMVGGRSYLESQYNRAAQAKRQPGSVFKMFVYLAAVESGIEPMEQVIDQPVTISIYGKPWSPTNYTGDYKGAMTLANAVAQSINTVAAQVGQRVGFRRIADTAARLGVKDIPARPSIALGAGEATLLDLTAAYAHFANRGHGVEPYGLTEIRTPDGRELYKRDGQALWVVVRESAVNMMNYLLSGSIEYGTGTAARIGRPAAGKTGTSSDFKDAWFIGYVPQRVAGIWVGNDNNTKMAKVTGGGLPAQIWAKYMKADLDGVPVEALPTATGGSWFESGSLPWNSSPSVVPPPQQMLPPGEEEEGNEEGEGVLTPEFWNKLMEGGTVEHSYPTEGRGRGAR